MGLRTRLVLTGLVVAALLCVWLIVLRGAGGSYAGPFLQVSAFDWTPAVVGLALLVVPAAVLAFIWAD